jgi:CrcB protein
VREALLVALGGALGSVLRWAVAIGVARATREPQFPWGTLVVNLAGSLLIGVLLGLATDRGALATPARLFLVTGLLGGFTTFSAFSWEALALLRAGHTGAAGGYVASSVLGGLLAAAAGWLLATKLAA